MSSVDRLLLVYNADWNLLGGLRYAAEVAKTIGTEHREISIGPDDFFDALPKLIWHEDEPIVWPSSVSLHFVSKLAAEDVKVVVRVTHLMADLCNG